MSFGAAKLVGILAEEASEKELAIGGMREDRMGLQQSLRSDRLFAGASEALDGLESGLRVPGLTPPALGRQFLLANARADGDVEHECGDAGHLVSGALVTEVKLLTFVGIFVIKNAVGPRAARVDAGLRLLDKLSFTAVNSVWQLTSLLVAVAVVEEEAVFAQLGAGHVVLADVVQVALLGVGKQHVGLWKLDGEG